MNKSPSPIRFGPFEVNLAAGELRKAGTRIKLQDQPFRILTILLSRPGEVVTREELREKLWPDGTFVEFEHSLNTSINKLRRALNDSADTPRYIETVPRRGYRFVGDVERVAVTQPRRRLLPRQLAGVAAVAVAIAAVFLVARLLDEAPLEPPRRFV
ncbi:MAG: transcriptional regulator, partial [bacterium]|nr:transcriptional regulator [bacterium]